jgi:hypothetical protein
VVSVVWWEYWETVCLSTSTDRFWKYFHVGRDLFEDRYSKEAHSGKFALYPLEAMEIFFFFFPLYFDATNHL